MAALPADPDAHPDPDARPDPDVDRLAGRRHPDHGRAGRLPAGPAFGGGVIIGEADAPEERGILGA